MMEAARGLSPEKGSGGGAAGLKLSEVDEAVDVDDVGC
jgi:hypothetical protein